MAYRILIVDDGSALQRMVGEILTQAGYETESALSCAQALERFRAAPPDGVLLDVILPDGDGFSLFGRLRELRDVPVLFLSARDEDEARLRGLGLGADDYITKPFLPQELLLRLNAVLRRVYREESQTTRLGDTVIDWGKGTVRRGGAETALIATSLPLIFNHPYVPMNMVPFIDVLEGRGDFFKQIGLNVLMTIPYGILLPMNTRKNFSSVVIYAFLMSLSIELLQPLINGARSSDVTDIITNVLGAVIGYVIYLLIKPRLKKLNRQRKNIFELKDGYK